MLAAALAAPAQAEVVDRVLAIVGTQLITLSDAYAALALRLVDASAAADPIGAALDALIDRRLVLTEVERYQPPEPDVIAIERRVAELRRALPAGVAPGEALAPLALDDQRLRSLARDDLRIDAYLPQRFGATQPTDEEVARYYRDHVADFTRGGVAQPLAEVQEDLRAMLGAEQRRQVIADWIGDLRRRADINVLYLPGGSGARR
jgi:hypothetical protein